MSQLYLGTQKITPVYNRKKFNVDVDAFLGDVNSSGEYNRPSTYADIVFNGVKSLGYYALKYFFDSATMIGSVSFPDLETALGTHCLYCTFTDATTITSISMPKLTRIGGYSGYSCFVRCGITSMDFPELTTIDYNGLSNAFYESRVTSVTFPKLQTIGSNGLNGAFRNSTSMNGKSLSFPSLNSSSFGGNTNCFSNMLGGITGCTVHFPSNLQSVIGSWSDVTNGFGGTNTTVLFDLTATT